MDNCEMWIIQCIYFTEPQSKKYNCNLFIRNKIHNLHADAYCLHKQSLLFVCIDDSVCATDPESRLLPTFISH